MKVNMHISNKYYMYNRYSSQSHILFCIFIHLPANFGLNISPPDKAAGIKYIG